MTITAKQAAKLLEGGLVEALRSQRQLDADGCEVGVSRQACDEAADAISNLARALIASEAALKLAEERLAVAQTIARQGKDTIATVLLLEIAAALADHERVLLTRDESSLGPRVMEFAAIIKEIDNG